MDSTYEKIRQLNEQAWLDRNKDIPKSLKMAQKVQTLLADCPEAGTLDLVLSLRTQGYCLDHLGRYSDALSLSMQAMELANELGDSRLVASIDTVLGSIHWHLADYSSSLDYYMHGLRLVAVDPDPELEIYLLQGLGALHHEIGDYEGALKFFKSSIESTRPGDVMGKAIGLNNTAYTLHVMERSEEALPFALQALQLYNSEPLSVGKLELMHTLGSIYLQLGDIGRSSLYFEQAAHEAGYHENPLQMINALFGLCQIHGLRGEFEEAMQKLLRILKISQEIDSPASECSAHELLARYYKDLGDYRAALEHYEAFHTIYVQIYNDEAERRLHNVRLLLEVETVQKQANLYRTLAATDALTGLLSRREFFDLAEKMVGEAQLRRASVSLLMVDLDNFKAINDQSGHAVGDQVLSIVSRRIKNTLRQDALAGRYGGDEFVILMSETDLPACLRIAERCSSVVSEEPIEVDALRFWMNISIGLAVSKADGIRLEDLIQEADRALLNAKKSGRNRISSSELPEPPGPE